MARRDASVARVRTGTGLGVRRRHAPRHRNIKKTAIAKVFDETRRAGERRAPRPSLLAAGMLRGVRRRHAPQYKKKDPRSGLQSRLHPCALGRAVLRVAFRKQNRKRLENPSIMTRLSPK